MKHLEVMDDIYERYGEYIEMQQDQSAFVVELMAKRIVKLNDYIEYLEKRLNV